MTILNDNEDISIILGAFNVDVLNYDVHEQLINALTNLQLLSHNITPLNGTHIDQIYIQNVFFFPETVTVRASVVNTYFSDHDAVRVDCYGIDIVDFHCEVNV